MIGRMFDWMTSPTADHLGSFLSGLSTFLFILSLLAGYYGWKRNKKRELAAIEKSKIEEKVRRNKDLEQVTAKLLGDINHSSGMLFVERAKIWAEALQWSANDRSARFVLVKAAVRTTMLALSNIESVIKNAIENGVGENLKEPIADAVRVLTMTAQEDIDLIKYFSNKDDRIMQRSRSKRMRRIETNDITDSSFENTHQAVDDLNEVLFSYLELPKLQRELSEQLEKLNLSLDDYNKSRQS